MTILCADPGLAFKARREEILAAMHKCLDSGWYILGEEVKAFEEEFARFHGVPFCTGVANGTDAITLALKAASIPPGSEVITVSHSAVATAAAIELAGLKPVFADIDRRTRCMDPAKAEALIGPETRAIVLVHIYGQPADVPSILSLCRKHNLILIEDCAQAHAAKMNGQLVGTFGDLAAYSFYPTKNLGALGDGGAVITSNPDYAEKLRLLRQYGWKERYISVISGANSRLDEVQAAVLRVRLKYLEQDNERRRQIASQYDEALDGRVMVAPSRIENTVHAMHLYVMECAERDALKEFLGKKGIQAGLHYPKAIHQQEAYSKVKGADKLPVTEELYSRILSLPMYPELSDDKVRNIKVAIRDWLGSRAG
jgi:dTDP-4-amino-4,6-dideoxygalactose transaminase